VALDLQLALRMVVGSRNSDPIQALGRNRRLGMKAWEFGDVMALVVAVAIAAVAMEGARISL